MARVKYFIILFALIINGCKGEATSLPSDSADSANTRRLPVEEYRQKMMAGWLGQMVGVSYGAPTEFRYLATIMPASDVPSLQAGMANNAFGQDDLYVEMTFLKTLEIYGLEVSITQAGVDFANSQYELWHANKAGRDNLRASIAPPDSSHPQFNAHADDIDYQIESDFAGLISPGLPGNAIDLGEKFGRLMNYGDGLYAGQFMSCLYAEAFFETDPVNLVETALTCIPAQSQYAEAIRDVLSNYQEHPDDWQITWEQINQKYLQNDEYRRYSCQDEYFTSRDFDIDAKLNGAFVVMGLLYGKGDIEQTMTIAMRSGQDSDCNPSSAAGVLFTTFGLNNLPDLYTSDINRSQKFSYTAYNFDQLVEVSEMLARQAVLKAGGQIEVDADGKEIFVIPQQKAIPSAFVQSWQPGPLAGSSFSPEELEQLPKSMAADMRRFAPGWNMVGCLDDELLGLHEEIQGKQDVLITAPEDDNAPCRLTTSLKLPAETAQSLHFWAGHYPGGRWELSVKGNNQQLFAQTIANRTAPEGWLEIWIDLSQFAGQDLFLELAQQPGKVSFEGAYWAGIEIVNQE